MKKIYLILFFFVLHLNGQGQNWLWAKKISLDSYDGWYDMAIGPDGSMYIGTAYNTSGISFGSAGIILSKFDSNGQFMWNDNIYITPQNDRPYCSIYFFNGHIYLRSQFSSIAYVGDSTFSTPTGGSTELLIRYNLEGTKELIKAIPCTGEIHCHDLYCDTHDNIYLTGSFSNHCYFDNDLVKSAKGKRDLFLVKYNGFGNLTLFKQAWSIDTTLNSSEVQGENILVYDDGKMILTGSFRAGIVFDTITDTYFGGEDRKFFIYSIDSSGTIDELNYKTETSMQMSFSNLLSDHNRNLDFLKNYYFAHGGWNSIEKYTSSYTPLDTIHFYFSSDISSASITDYTLNHNDNTFFAGKWVPDCYSNDASFLFTVAKYDNNNNLQWIDTTVNHEKGFYERIGCDTVDNIYLLGFYKDTIHIAGVSLISDPGQYYSWFIAKIHDGTPTVTLIPEYTESLFTLSPNPTKGQFNLQLNEGLKTQVKQGDMILVFDVVGNCILRQRFSNSQTQQIDISKMSKGIYFVEVEYQGGRMNKKIVLN